MCLLYLKLNGWFGLFFNHLEHIGNIRWHLLNKRTVLKRQMLTHNKLNRFSLHRLHIDFFQL